MTTTEKAAAPPLKKVSFGAIAKKKEDTRTEYPVYRDAQAAEIAARIIERTDQLNAIEGALKTDKADLKMLSSPFYFEQAHGKAEVPSSVSVPSEKGEVLVTFQNRYTELPDESSLVPILGERVGKYFGQTFSLKIDGDKLPPESVEALLADLNTLFAQYGATEALTVKDGVKPVKDFHVRRHLELSVAENLALDQACPIIAMCKTKGLRK